MTRTPILPPDWVNASFVEDETLISQCFISRDSLLSELCDISLTFNGQQHPGRHKGRLEKYLSECGESGLHLEVRQEAFFITT